MKMKNENFKIYFTSDIRVLNNAREDETMIE
jgi:hypothetical protein